MTGIPKRSRWALCVTLSLAAVGLCIPSAQATKVIPLALPELVASADRVVHGVVTEVRAGTDEETGLICTWTTLKVDEPLKGKVETAEITFKQLGGTDVKRGLTNHVQRVQLGKGAEILLFLYPKSELGFSAPVGIAQGSFNVVIHPKTKEKHLTNGMPKHILFSDRPHPPQSRLKSKMVPYDKEIMKALGQCNSMKLDDMKRGVARMVNFYAKKAAAKKAAAK